jgi:hypothetical protein
MSIPYRVLFSNEMTNILTCKSPYNERGCMGIDVHMLQPGLGWVPWWKSRHYPFAELIRFMRERTGMEPSADPYSAYMAAGGDMVEAFTRRCREHGLAPFVSFRLNDSHGHEFVECDPKDLPSWAWFCFSPVHVNHPEWRLGADLNDWNNRVPERKGIVKSDL